MKAILEDKGYCVVPGLFDLTERERIIAALEAAVTEGPSFRRSGDLFAIRRFLAEIPAMAALLFTDKLKALLDTCGGPGYFISKSIYFDKPGRSNWFVAYHQDLTIAVSGKKELPGYGPWTTKQDQFAVQPPLSMLEENFTIRIHLDDTDESNGALKVVPGSHRKGIYRPETIDWSVEQEDTVAVPAGGVMLMKPLLLHASRRSTGAQRRRVIHLECSKAVLPSGIQWSEQFVY